MTRRLLTLLTAAVLVVLVAFLPRLAPEQGEDTFPTTAELGETVDLDGGSIAIDSMTAAPAFNDGLDVVTLEDGLFLQVELTVNPDQVASVPLGWIESAGRTYEASDLSDTDRSEPGFDSTVWLLFEVPEDALDSGTLRLQFQRSSDAAIKLNGDTVTRLDEVGPAEDDE